MTKLMLVPVKLTDSMKKHFSIVEFLVEKHGRNRTTKTPEAEKGVLEQLPLMQGILQGESNYSKMFKKYRMGNIPPLTSTS